MTEAAYRFKIATPWTATLCMSSMAFGLLFVHLSATPVIQLRPYPPAEFFDVSQEWDTERRKAEEHLGQAYWECTVRTLQWKYTYGSLLPDEPPPEFKINTQRFPGGLTTASSSRARYWRSTQKAWLLPHAWQKSYRWDTRWLFEGQ